MFIKLESAINSKLRDGDDYVKVAYRDDLERYRSSALVKVDLN